jgi:serine/threonine protein kinase
MSEIRILQTVVHPNIVKLLDYVERKVRIPWDVPRSHSMPHRVQ